MRRSLGVNMVTLAQQRGLVKPTYEEQTSAAVRASITGKPSPTPTASFTPQPTATTPAATGTGGLGQLTTGPANPGQFEGSGTPAAPAPPAATATGAVPTGTGPAGMPSVAERVDTIIGADSPLMQRARTFGLQSANRRGLGNSSMAVEAAQSAVLDAATPIASQESTLAQQDNIAGREEALRMDMLTRELSQRDRDQLAATIAQMNSTQLQALADTLNNPDIPAETRAAMQEAIRAQTQQGINYMQNLYGVSVSNATPTQAAVPQPYSGGLGAYVPSYPYGGAQ